MRRELRLPCCNAGCFKPIGPIWRRSKHGRDCPVLCAVDVDILKSTCSQELANAVADTWVSFDGAWTTLASPEL